MQRSAVLAGAILSAMAGAAAAQTTIPTRTPLATIPLSSDKVVSRLETTRVDFLPGQAMPTHKHTVPVICFVTKGELLVSIGDAPERKANVGAVTFEPPEVIVHYFKNASATDAAQLNCASLAGAEDHTLNVMLNK